jgi:hypothetical protein
VEAKVLMKCTHCGRKIGVFETRYKWVGKKRAVCTECYKKHLNESPEKQEQWEIEAKESEKQPFKDTEKRKQTSPTVLERTERKSDRNWRILSFLIGCGLSLESAGIASSVTSMLNNPFKVQYIPGWIVKTWIDYKLVSVEDLYAMPIYFYFHYFMAGVVVSCLLFVWALRPGRGFRNWRLTILILFFGSAMTVFSIWGSYWAMQLEHSLGSMLGQFLLYAPFGLVGIISIINVVFWRQINEYYLKIGLGLSIIVPVAIYSYTSYFFNYDFLFVLMVISLCISLSVVFFTLVLTKKPIAIYKKAVQRKPEDAKAHFDLGNALLRERLFDDAITEYKKVLELKPDYAEAYNGLGTVLIWKGLYIEAINGFKKAVELKSDYIEAWNNLGIMYEDLGQYEKAVEAYDESIKLLPFLNPAKANKQEILDRKKR